MIVHSVFSEMNDSNVKKPAFAGSKWYGWRDSNPQNPDFKSGTYTNSITPTLEFELQQAVYKPSIADWFAITIISVIEDKVFGLLQV